MESIMKRLYVTHGACRTVYGLGVQKVNIYIYVKTQKFYLGHKRLHKMEACSARHYLTGSHRTTIEKSTVGSQTKERNIIMGFRTKNNIKFMQY
jgi:hypothetical protein